MLLFRNCDSPLSGHSRQGRRWIWYPGSCSISVYVTTRSTDVIKLSTSDHWMTPNCVVSTSGWSVYTNEKAVTPDEERTKKRLMQNNWKHLLYKPSWLPETVIAGLQAVFFSFVFSKVEEGPQTQALSDLEIKLSLWHNESRAPFLLSTTDHDDRTKSGLEGRDCSSPPFFLRDSRASEMRRGGEREKFFSLPAACRLFSRGVIFTRARVSLALQSLMTNGGPLVVYFWKKERSAKRANFTWLRPNYQLLKHNQSNEKKKKHVTAKSQPTNSRENHEPRLIVAVLSSEKKTVKMIFWIDSTGRIYSWISDFAMNILPAEFGFLEHSFSRMTKSQYHNNMQNSCTKKWET